jgi:hypothetical protein
MYHAFVIAVLLLVMPAPTEKLTFESWNNSEEMIFFQLRTLQIPIPYKGLKGKDELTSQVYIHGFVRGWDVGIQIDGSHQPKPVVPALLTGDSIKTDVWLKAYYDGQLTGIAARRKVKEELAAKKKQPPPPVMPIKK